MSINEDNFLTKAISKKISRRSFIKWSSALGATASMSGLVMQAGSKVAGASHGAPAAGVGGSIVEWKPSCCLVCHSWCAIAAGIDANGHVRKVEGCGGQPKNYPGTSTPIGIVGIGSSGATAEVTQHKSDDANHIPTTAGYLAYSPHNKGRICAKGNDGVEHLYDPDRIKYPLKRIGERGEGMWRKVSWATALGEIADVLRDMAERGKQHRLVAWVGRNENFVPKTFTKTYGSPNHIEHTSLCELSRHAAGRTMWGHHWSSVDLQEHADVSITTANYVGSMTLDRNVHDIDFYIEWGGNPAEAKIPHSSCANHLADRRRSNLVGYNHASRLGGVGVTTYGRIATIDVRQSNTAAYSDDFFQIIPGSDGALALYLIRAVLAGSPDGDTAANATDVRHELERGHNGGTGGLIDGEGGYDASGRFYYGLFAAEEAGGAASGAVVPVAVAAGKSLEKYLFSGHADAQFDVHLGLAGGNTGAEIQTRVAAVTGISETDLEYLANVYIDGYGGRFVNVVCDGYRGPCKHTNGTYNYRAIRALQLLAPNFSAQTFHSGLGGESVARGGYNAPGAFQSDKNWNPYGGKLGNGGGTGSNPKAGGSEDVPGAFNAIDDGASGLPLDEAVGGHDYAPSEHGAQRIDNWDYELDITRWRASYKWVDQNVQCGIRHSIGLSAFALGGLADVSVEGPYGPSNPNNQGAGAYDADFKVEALLWHKNAPTYSRPGQDNEIEMLIAKDASTSTGYALEHAWAIDLNMGDGTRFADIILPDVSYLERYAGRSGEGQEFNYRDNTFFRMPVYEIDGDAIDGEVIPQHMYDSKQVGAIYYELARIIESSGHSSTADVPVGDVSNIVLSGTSNAQAYIPAGAAVTLRISGHATLDDVTLDMGTVTANNGSGTDIDTSASTGADYDALGYTAAHVVTGPASSPWKGHLYASHTWTEDDAGSVADNSTDGKAYINEGEWARQKHFEILCNDSSALGCGTVAPGSVSGADYVRAHGMLWGTDDDPAYWRDGGFKGDGHEVGEKHFPGGDSYAHHNGFKMKTMKQALQIFNNVLDTTPDIDGTETDACRPGTGNFFGIPVYRPTILQSNTTYPRHLTTYKVSVHCHARTACMPRLAEILGNSWVVLAPDAVGGLTATLDDTQTVVNGDVVTVSSPAGSLTAVVKVTDKAQANCVHISHHQGHQRGIYTIEADSAYSNPHREAYGTYLVDGVVNRDQDTTLNNPSGGPLTSWVNSTVTGPPTAPGKGTHGNRITVHHINGAATGDNYNTDPVGGSQGWFGTKVRVIKV